MNQRSISAYNLPERVAAYDADMELMHPNRSKMVQIALEVMPYDSDARLTALDIGIGTAYFTERFLAAFPRSTVYGIDGAEAMVNLAKARLGSRAESVDFRVGDLRDLEELLSDVKRIYVAYSSYALHHLSRQEKTAVVSKLASLLRPGGRFVNAGIIRAETAPVEEMIQNIRVNGIVGRAQEADPRFRSREATRAFLDELEAREGDQPLALKDDLRAWADAGLRDVAVFWIEYREAVTGGRS